MSWLSVYLTIGVTLLQYLASDEDLRHCFEPLQVLGYTGKMIVGFIALSFVVMMWPFFFIKVIK